MTSIYKFIDLYTCNKEDVKQINIIQEKLTIDDLLLIFTFTNLQFLTLIKNDIDEIPEEISNLKNLVRLEIEYNNIKRLPTSIKYLNLEFLIIGNNNIDCIQDEIFEFKNLKYLIINNNRIAEIPKKINKLENLRNLIIDNISCGCFYASFKIKNIIVRLDISNFKYKHNQNNIIELPDEIAYLQFLVQCYIPELKDNYKIFGEDMIIFQRNEISIIIPDNIKNLIIIFKTFPNQNMLSLLNNLPIGIERLSLSNVNINIKLENLPIGLKGLFFYTAPYCGLPERYSDWTRHIVKEDIMQIKIPFGCKAYLNDDEIYFE